MVSNRNKSKYQKKRKLNGKQKLQNVSFVLEKLEKLGIDTLKRHFFLQSFKKMFNSCSKIFHLGGRTFIF